MSNSQNKQHFNKSESPAGAIVNLALAIPPAMFRALASKVLNFANSYFENMLKIVFDVNTNSKNWDHEVDKSKKMAKILIFVTTEVLKQPDVQKLFLDLVEELKVFIEKANEVLKESLEQTQKIIEEEGNKASTAAYKITRQASQSAMDGVLDSANAAPPPIGPLISALRAAGDIITPIQTVTQETLKVTLSVAEKLINLMKELEVSGFGAAEASIKAIKTGITMTDTVTSKIDSVRKALEEPTIQKGGNNYVPAKNIPSPSFKPADKSAYELATQPRAGLKIPSKLQKALNEMDNLAKKAIEAKKEAERKKKEFENAKQMAKNIKNAPGKLKKQAKNSIKAIKNNVKKSVNNAKKNLKQEISTTKKALKGGRKTQRRKSTKSKSKSRKSRKH
jgi:hypothetical protein